MSLPVLDMNPLIQALSERAKKLMIEMEERTGRQPDIADFKAAFADEIKKFLLNPRWT